jgi:hypothetical protein
MEEKKISKYKRNAVFADLKEYDVFAKEHDFVEVTEWYNGEGWDVYISTRNDNKMFSLSYGQFKAIKKLIKKLGNG